MTDSAEAPEDRADGRRAQRSVGHYVRDRTTGEFVRAELRPERLRDASADTVDIPLMTRLNERGFRILMVLDVVALLAVMVGTMFYRFGAEWPTGPGGRYTQQAYLLSFVVIAGLHFAMFYFGGLYEREPRLGRPPVLPRVFTLSFGAILAFALLAFVTGGTGVRPLPAPSINLAVLLVVGSLAVTGNRALARANRRRLEGPPRVLLIGAPDEVATARTHLEDERPGKVQLAGDTSSTTDLLDRVEQLRVSDVVLLSARSLDDLFPELIRELEARDVSVLQRVTAKETLYGLARVRQVGGMPFVPLRQHTLPIARVRFKRFVELSGLVATAPLWLGLLGVLCLYELIVVGRPIFYWQVRVGRDGELFDMVKFRTMRRDAEALSGPQLAADRDPRVIPACRWLRASRLDELPQLWNVFRGEMSLVGPRPERPELTARFERLIPGYATRYEIPPGITGLAQVHGGYHTDPEYKLGYDIHYLVNWSPLLDLEILLRTVWVVLRRRF